MQNNQSTKLDWYVCPIWPSSEEYEWIMWLTMHFPVMFALIFSLVPQEVVSQTQIYIIYRINAIDKKEYEMSSIPHFQRKYFFLKIITNSLHLHFHTICI